MFFTYAECSVDAVLGSLRCPSLASGHLYPPALQCTCFRRYISLLLTSRLLRRTLKAGCAQLIIVSFLHLSVPLGFTITFAVGFGAVDRVESET